MTILCIDIGGTEIKSAIYNLKGELVFAFENLPTSITKNNNQIKEQVLSIGERALEKYHIKGVAIATAGVVDVNSGTIVQAGQTIPNYIGTNLKSAIESRFNLPCTVENDVNAVAFGEAWLGGAQHSDSTLFITLGTGLGGAVIINGKLWRGANFAAGEIGQLPLGNGKNLEELASTTALLANYQKYTNEVIDGKIFFQRFRQADQYAELALTEMLDVLSDGLLSSIYLMAPEMIVIGGGIATQHDILIPRLQTLLQNKVSAPHFMPKHIICATLGNKAGMIGALRCFLNEHKNIL